MHPSELPLTNPNLKIWQAELKSVAYPAHLVSCYLKKETIIITSKNPPHEEKKKKNLLHDPAIKMSPEGKVLQIISDEEGSWGPWLETGELLFRMKISPFV